MKHPLSLKRLVYQLRMRRHSLVVIEHDRSQLILELSLNQRLHYYQRLMKHQQSLRHLVRQLTNRKHNLAVVEHSPNRQAR